jgi:imidazolonepropionase-like amidohydrolase
MYDAIPRAQAAGVRLVLGDDYGAVGFPHGAYGGELRLYAAEAGIAPLDLIGWATRNGAELVGRAEDLGTLEVGKVADMLVLEGDPSDDIGALADQPPFAVIKAGQLVSGTSEES